MTDPTPVIEAAVAEADALLRKRLAAAGIQLPMFAASVTPQISLKAFRRKG